ncbi:MAG: hypothetical protein JXA54_16070 [Candidatus Heimdallarchaeota archaeon]|nr:hypothetical protein [Candidatus Heimdallarchaeota archaeon]
MSEPIFNHNIANAVLFSKKTFVRNKKDIDRISDIFFETLKNNLTNKEWLIILQRITGFKRGIFSFLLRVFKQTDGTIYSKMILNPYETKLKKFRKQLKLWFSSSQKRKRLKDDIWLEEQDKEYLLTLLENALENGLDEKTRESFDNLLYPNKFIYFEFKVEKKGKDPELILNYY